jgi:hypothetical protein
LLQTRHRPLSASLEFSKYVLDSSITVSWPISSPLTYRTFLLSSDFAEITPLPIFSSSQYPPFLVHMLLQQIPLFAQAFAKKFLVNLT